MSKTPIAHPLHPQYSSQSALEVEDVSQKFARVLRLELLAGGREGEEKVRVLDKNRLVIGSVATADIRLEGEGVAPLHAVLERSAEAPYRYTLYDLASETGVLVNGESVVLMELPLSCELAIGVYRFKAQTGMPEKLRNQDGLVTTAEGKTLYVGSAEELKGLALDLGEDRDLSEIFDYRGTDRPALEVIMSWNDLILQVEHFVDQEEVMLGGKPSDDFGIPPLLSSESFRIVTKLGDHFVLNLSPEMKGVIQRQGKVLRIHEAETNELKSSITRDPNGVHLKLEKDDFVKVALREIDFYLSYTAAPPSLKRRKLMERDPLFFKIASSSLGVSALLLFLIWQIKAPEITPPEQLPDRLATILYQPEKYVAKPKPMPKEPPSALQEAKATPPAPPKKVRIDLENKPLDPKKPVPKELALGQTPQKQPKVTKGQKGVQGPRAQGQAQEGQGARAKGPEGSRGQKNAARSNEKQDMAFRPSPQAGEGRGSGDSQIIDEGNVDFLKGASGKIQDLLGNSAQKLGKGGEKLKGFGGFTTRGQGGLALEGGGTGGGGNAASLGGLSDKGRGGGKIGTGMGAAGTGSGIVGGKGRVVLRTGGPEESVVTGAIDRDAVLAAILAHKDEFRLCYEREINAENQDLAGQVSTSFVIGSSGRVTQAGVVSSSLKNAAVEGCILKVLRRIPFPIPQGGGIVEVRFPFKFRSIGG